MPTGIAMRQCGLRGRRWPKAIVSDSTCTGAVGRVGFAALTMKAKIHPEYVDAVIHCACGNILKTRSTRKDMRIGICSKCHPFFTGTQKFVDTAGRVERFQKRYAKKTK